MSPPWSVKNSKMCALASSVPWLWLPMLNIAAVRVKYVVSAFICPLTLAIKTLRSNRISYVNGVPNTKVPSRWKPLTASVLVTPGQVATPMTITSGAGNPRVQHASKGVQLL